MEKYTPKYITIKLLKTHDKEKILNAAREKRYYIREMKIKSIENLLLEAKQVRG